MQEVPLTLGRTLKVWWALTWRTLLATIIVGFLAGLVVALFGPALGIGSAEELQRSATWQLLMGVLGIAVTLGVLQWVFHLRFSDFRLALVSRDERPSATPGDTLAETQSRAAGPPRPDPPEAWEAPPRRDEPER